ncbi:MAG: hypothetical protein ACT4QF_15010 [Sporichthyaceae bacterium]|jgi:hypothetical protein
MLRIVGVSMAALLAVPLAIGGVETAAVAEGPARAVDGSPKIGGDDGPLGTGKRKKERHRERGSSVAGIEPGDNVLEEGQNSVPDTNGIGTGNGDGPLGTG